MHYVATKVKQLVNKIVTHWSKKLESCCWEVEKKQGHFTLSITLKQYALSFKAKTTWAKQTMCLHRAVEVRFIKCLRIVCYNLKFICSDVQYRVRKCCINGPSLERRCIFPIPWDRDVGPAIGRLGVRNPAATDLSGKNR